MSSRTLFVLLNVLGGIAVLGSYAWGIGLYPELWDAFWGGVPESLRPLYTANMFLAAAGYIGAFAFFLAREDADHFGRLLLPYGLILIPSALWLPLTVWVLQAPSDALWLLVRADLFAVGLGGLWLLPAVWKTPAGGAGIKSLVSLGLCFFCLQTAVLDALVWPHYFELPVN